MPRTLRVLAMTKKGKEWVLAMTVHRERVGARNDGKGERARLQNSKKSLIIAKNMSEYIILISLLTHRCIIIIEVNLSF